MYSKINFMAYKIYFDMSDNCLIIRYIHLMPAYQGEQA